VASQDWALKEPEGNDFGGLTEAGDSFLSQHSTPTLQKPRVVGTFIFSLTSIFF
jgi:hypothetical protein